MSANIINQMYDLEKKEYLLEELVVPSNGAWGAEKSSEETKAVLVLGVGNVTNEGFLNLSGASIRHLSTLEQTAIANEGDLLLVKSSGSSSNIRSGKTAICPPELSGKIACSNFMYKLSVNKELADPYLLWLLLNSQKAKSFVKLIAGASTYPNIKWDKYKNFELSLPNIEVQNKLSIQLRKQLTEVETAKQAAQRQLVDTSLLRARLLKAFFAELHTAPKKKLGDYAPTTSGSTPSRGNKQYWQPAEIAWVKTGEVAFAPITATEEAISKQALAECSLTLLPSKTILIAMIGQGKTRGQSAILEIPATTNQNCFAVLPNDTWEPDFLYLWMKSSYQDLRDLSADRGGSQAALNGALLNALEVPAPSKTEQQNIVARIQAAMTKIDTLENSIKAALEDIKQLPNRVLAQAFAE